MKTIEFYSSEVHSIRKTLKSRLIYINNQVEFLKQEQKLLKKQISDLDDKLNYKPLSKTKIVFRSAHSKEAYLLAKELKKKGGLTIREIADQVKMSKTTVGNWLK